MSRHAASLCGVPHSASRGPGDLHSYPYSLCYAGDNERFPPLPGSNHLSKSFDSIVTDTSSNEESQSSTSAVRSRPSLRRRFTEGLRSRAISFKSELSFGKKDKRDPQSKSVSVSRRGSGHQSDLNSPSQSVSEFQESPQSTSSSALPKWSYYTPVTSPESSPKTPPIMAMRQSAARLDPAAAQRRQTITESKARSHQIAVEEEKALRERMKRNGIEDHFPKYKFVDFIGKGTYGRVYQA